MESLPLEIEKTIASFVDDKTKRQLRLANSKWFKIIDYRDFTLYLTKTSEWKQIVDRFEQYSAPISLVLAKNIMENPHNFLEHLSRLKNLERLHVHSADRNYAEESTWYGLTTLTNLKRLYFGLVFIPIEVWAKLPQLETFHESGLMDSEMVQLSSSLTNLRELAAELNSNRLEVLDNLHFSKLTRLDTYISNDGYGCCPNLQTRLYNVKELVLRTAKVQSQEVPVFSLKYMTALEKLTTWFPISDVNSPKLIELHMEDAITEQEKQLFPFLGNLEHFEQTTIDSTEHLTSLTRLSSLTLGGSQIPPYDVLRNIRSSRLQKLTLTWLWTIDFGYLTRLDSIKDLDLDCTFCDDNITALTNLEKLSFSGLDEDVRNWIPLLKSLSRLTNLHYLRCSGSNVTSTPIDLSPLINLDYLSLALDAASFSGYGVLTNLTYLHLTTNEVSTVWDLTDFNLTNLTNLQHLGFSTADSNVMQYATSLRNLQSIDFYMCHGNSELESLTVLSKLTALMFNSYGNAAVESLTVLPNLQDLYWPEVLDEDEKEMVRAALPNLSRFLNFT